MGMGMAERSPRSLLITCCHSPARVCRCVVSSSALLTVCRGGLGRRRLTCLLESVD